MSDQGERPGYDVAELRRCITLSFSAGDLRELAEGLGARGLPGFDRGIQEAAREVVRHFERQGDLPRLVEKLAEARPLMEWPTKAKQSVPEKTPPPFAPAPEAAIAAAAAAAAVTAPDPASAPAPAPAPASASAPAPAPASAPAPAPAPVLRDPYAAGWPATQSPGAAPASRGVEGRKFTMMLVIGGISITVIAIGAFLVGRAGSHQDGPAPVLTGKDALAKGERPLRENGAARLAADAVDRSFVHLARGCDLTIAPNVKVGPWLFKTAYEECGARPGLGRPPNLPRIPQPDGSALPPDPSDTEPTGDPTPRPKRTAPDRGPSTKPGATADKAPPTNAADACMDKCAGSLRNCNGSCGAEPTSSSQYGPWQSCKAQCLAAVSKCRQACQ